MVSGHNQVLNAHLSQRDCWLERWPESACSRVARGAWGVVGVRHGELCWICCRTYGGSCEMGRQWWPGVCSCVNLNEGWAGQSLRWSRTSNNLAPVLLHLTESDIHYCQKTRVVCVSVTRPGHLERTPLVVIAGIRCEQYTLLHVCCSQALAFPGDR